MAAVNHQEEPRTHTYTHAWVRNERKSDYCDCVIGEEIVS